MTSHTDRRGRVLVPLAVVAATLALTAGACDPEHIGPAGTVVRKEHIRWDCTGRCKARVWLTTRPGARTTHRFEVSLPTYRACDVGDAYPACKP